VNTNTVAKIKIERDVASVAYRRRARGLQIAARLEQVILGMIAKGVIEADVLEAIEGSEAKRALGVSHLVEQCVCKENIWMGADLHNEDGELYEGVGTLTGCSSRLCPFCAADIRKRSRKKAREAVKWIEGNKVDVELQMRKTLEEMAKKVGKTKREEIEKRLRKPKLDLRWRFVTLTAPTVIGRSLLETIRVYNGAFARLMKREFWLCWVAGGIKGSEYTLGDDEVNWSPDKDGYHVHLHLMIFAEWLPWEQLQEEWTDCIVKAWADVGHRLEINTTSGKVLTRISLVVPRARKGGQGVISQESAIQEVIKYVTKTDTWLRVPDAHLFECATVKRWPRMFELFGVARESNRKKEEIVRQETVVEESPTILDTPNLKVEGSGLEGGAEPGGLNHGETKTKTRDLPMLDWLDFMPFSEWVVKVGIKLNKSRWFRKQMLADKYFSASFVTLDGERFGVLNFSRNQ
jgi:Replication protein